MGGRPMLTFTFTPAIVGIGTAIANAKSAIPKNNFFILFPPLHLIVLCPIIALPTSYNQQHDAAHERNNSPFIF
jgi:hypothetical protein